LDILTLPAALVLLVSIYRAQDVIDNLAISPHRRGYYRYGLVWISFFGLLIDLPCNVLGLIASLFIYRGYWLIQDISRVSCRLGQHRLICLYHFGMMWLDILCMPLVVLLSVTIVRLPTLINKNGQFHTNVFKCCGLLVMDLLLLPLSIVILVLVQRIGPTCSKINYLNLRFNNDLPIDMVLTDAQRNGLEQLYTSCMYELVKWDGLPLSKSGSFYRPLFILEATTSIRKIHHFVLFPFRCFAKLFIPVHLYILWRLNVPILPANPEVLIQNGVTYSFLFQGILWLQIKQPTYTDFYRLERFLLVNLLSLPLLILNELAVLIMALHSIVIMSLSFGITSATSAENVGNCIYRLSQISRVLQGLVLPALVFLEVNWWFAPIYAASQSFMHVLTGNGPVISLWNPLPVGILSLPAIWTLWAIFLVVVAASIHLVYRFCLVIAKIFRPWQFWTQLIPLKLYSSLLASGTRLCYRMAKESSSRCSKLLGEILMMIITLLWILWPTYPVIHYRAWPWLGLTVPINVVLLFWSISIVKRHWSKTPFQDQKPPLPDEQDNEQLFNA